tara:strand:- start:87 stop:1151 length:1065 start_codon:yes stop_codon:yes gene_type:complete
MRVLKLLWRILWNLKTILISLILISSLAFNIILFLGGSLYSVINSGFEVITGIQTIGSRNKAEIVGLGDNLIVERKAKRELKGELAETSGQLVAERTVKRELKGQVAEISGELVVERKLKRELKSQVADISGDLVIERNIKRTLKSELAEQAATLAIERTTKRALKSELAEQAANLAIERTTKRALKVTMRNLSRGMVSFKGKKVAVQKAVEVTANKIGKRAQKSAARNVASMPGEAIPWLGTAVIVGVTALELHDLCATIKDMTELKKAFDPTLTSSEEELEVCAITVPPKDVILAAVKASPHKAWEKAKELTPSIEEISEMEMPEVNFQDLWSKTKTNTGDWTEKLKNYWDK